MTEIRAIERLQAYRRTGSFDQRGIRRRPYLKPRFSPELAQRTGAAISVTPRGPNVSKLGNFIARAGAQMRAWHTTHGLRGHARRLDFDFEHQTSQSRNTAAGIFAKEIVDRVPGLRGHLT